MHRDDANSVGGQMKLDWNERALSNVFYAIDSSRLEWSISEFYDQGQILVEEFVDPVLDLFGVDPSSGTVLEIGCGVGRLFPALSQRFTQVVGIDVSDQMIRLGKEMCPVQATWIVNDGSNIKGVHDGSVKHVLSYEVFQHIPNSQSIVQYMNEIMRVLQPGGTFQLHLRKGSDTRRQNLFRRLPRPMRISAGIILRWLRVLRIPGDIDTWLGKIIHPEQAHSILSQIGFTEIEILADHLQPPGMGYWIVGRKAST